MNTHNPFSTFLDYWRQLQGWDSVRVPLWICTLWDARYLLDFWIKRCSRTTVYPHTVWSTSCSNTICTLLRSSCSGLVVLEEYTEELSLCRAVCITSVINWILPRADFVEHFFLLFLRLDHLFAGSSLLRTPANAKGNQMFPIIPYNHTVIFSPTILPLSSQQNSNSDFLSLSWEAIFSLSLSSCHLLLLFFENWWNSHQPWVTNQLPCFLSLCQFWRSFGCLERPCWFIFFPPGR